MKAVEGKKFNFLPVVEDLEIMVPLQGVGSLGPVDDLDCVGLR